VADGQGFEPWCRIAATIAFRVRAFGPLRHPSRDIPREVSAVVSLSGKAQHPVGRVVVEFEAVAPGRGIIRKDAHLQQFRTSFNAFLQHLFAAGARVVHIHPATPLSASIEIGRLLLPKTFEEVHVWEWQAPEWRPALRLK
jgi:hypothetical protein